MADDFNNYPGSFPLALMRPNRLGRLAADLPDRRAASSAAVQVLQTLTP